MRLNRLLSKYEEAIYNVIFQITLIALKRVPENVDALVKVWRVFTSELYKETSNPLSWEDVYKIYTLHSVRGYCKLFNGVAMTSIQRLNPEKATDM